MRVLQDAVGIDEQRGGQSGRAVEARQIAELVDKYRIEREAGGGEIALDGGAAFALIGEDEGDVFRGGGDVGHHGHFAPAGRAPGRPQIDHLRRAFLRFETVAVALQRFKGLIRDGERVGAAGELPCRVPDDEGEGERQDSPEPLAAGWQHDEQADDDGGRSRRPVKAALPQREDAQRLGHKTFHVDEHMTEARADDAAEKRPPGPGVEAFVHPAGHDAGDDEEDEDGEHDGEAVCRKDERPERNGVHDQSASAVLAEPVRFSTVTEPTRRVPGTSRPVGSKKSMVGGPAT